MIVSAALLAPIIAVLYWLYAYTGKNRLTVGEYVMLAVIAAVVFGGTLLIHVMVGSQNGNLWEYILAPMVGYGLLLVGVGVAFWLRSKTAAH